MFYQGFTCTTFQVLRLFWDKTYNSYYIVLTILWKVDSYRNISFTVHWFPPAALRIDNHEDDEFSEPVSESSKLEIITYEDILVSCGFLYKTLHCSQRRETHGIGLMHFLNKFSFSCLLLNMVKNLLQCIWESCCYWSQTYTKDINWSDFAAWCSAWKMMKSATRHCRFSLRTCSVVQGLITVTGCSTPSLWQSGPGFLQSKAFDCKLGLRELCWMAVRAISVMDGRVFHPR